MGFRVLGSRPSLRRGAVSILCLKDVFVLPGLSFFGHQAVCGGNKEGQQVGDCAGKERIQLHVAPLIQSSLVQPWWHSCTSDLKAAVKTARHCSVEEVARMYESRVRRTLVAIVCPLGSAAGAGCNRRLECFVLNGISRAEVNCSAAILSSSSGK